MRLTLMSDYAMRLLLYVAAHRDRLCTVGEIAQAHQISRAHLTKVAHLLTQRGWLQSVRGKHGGLRLAQDPKQIMLGTVLRATEPDFAVVECLGTASGCGLQGSCGLTAVMQQATQAFLAPLDRTSLADIASAGTLKSVAPPHALNIVR